MIQISVISEEEKPDDNNNTAKSNLKTKVEMTEEEKHLDLV